MTVKDVTREMVLELIYWGQKENPLKKGEMVAGFDVGFNINRLDFHVGDGKYHNMGVEGKDVDILVTLEVVRGK